MAMHPESPIHGGGMGVLHLMPLIGLWTRFISPHILDHVMKELLQPRGRPLFRGFSTGLELTAGA